MAHKARWQLVGNPKNHNAGVRSEGKTQDVGKPHILGDEYSAPPLSLLEHLVVRSAAQANVTHVHRFPACGSQSRGRRAWHILANKEGRHSGPAANFLGRQHLGRVSQRRPNILQRDPVFLGNLGVRHAASQLAYDEFDRNSRPLDHRLAKSHAGIHYDTRGKLDFHGCFLLSVMPLGILPSCDTAGQLPYTIRAALDPTGGYVADVEKLPGCITQAETWEEAGEMIRDAMRGWIELRLEDGLPVPEPREETQPAKILVRLPRSLHRALIRAADQEGVSLNQFVLYQLAQAVGRTAAP